MVRVPGRGDLRMKKLTIRDIDLGGKRVLLRVDYNVQVDEGGVVDDLRLRESIPTIQALRAAGARIIICSHRGRPHGEIVEALRNAPVAAHLSRLLDVAVATVNDCVGPEVDAADRGAGCGRAADAGERALPSGGGGRRPGVRARAGRDRRGLRERRLRHRPPRTRLDRGRTPIRPRRRRPAAGAGGRLPRLRYRQS